MNVVEPDQMPSSVRSGATTTDDEKVIQRSRRRPTFMTPRSTRPMALAAAAVLLAVTLMSVTSMALFTDVETVPANTFTTGTIDLTASPASAVVTMPAMAPGDQVTAPLDVDNTGSLDLRYSMTSTTTEDVLAAELVMTVKSGVTTCDDANWTADGSTLYGGALGSTATVAVFGSNTAGADPGDRTLAPGSNEQLCLNVTLPLSTTAGQGVTTTATFTFDAEQTANNP